MTIASRRDSGQTNSRPTSADGGAMPTDSDVDLTDPAVYPLDPPRPCDVVMRGGITSGIVYPAAVCEIARSYRFKNVGGTSAGAIAAAATAAAELGRRRRAPGAGFAEVAKLPAWLGEDDHLFRLFRPQPETEPLFRILVALSQKRNGGKLHALAAALAGFKRWAAVGALPGVAAAGIAGAAGARSLADRSADPLDRLATGALGATGVVLAAAGVLIGLAIGTYQRAISAIPRNYYGLCTGNGEEESQGAGGAGAPGAPALTVWLHGLLSRLAGQPVSGRPLTFGDLWGLDQGARETAPQAWDEEARRTAADPSSRAINLEIMTTSITEARPYKFPLESRVFYFHPEEFRDFFPAPVVDWMVSHPRSTGAADERADALARAAGCVPLPEPADLPVVVAVRMSLSVPPLMSAVPLHAIDFTVPEERQRVERCWFSDGGVTSNFPLHFFDSPLPRWPTFGINLRSARPGIEPDSDEGRNVILATSNADGRLQPWHRFDDAPSSAGGKAGRDSGYRGSIGGYFDAILKSMQNWTDNLQVAQPGYRDRVAHVTLAPHEGGMNLRMDGPIVARLSARGRNAGMRLARRFATPAGDGTPLTWDNHRWLRYRRVMASLEDFLERFKHSYTGDGSAEEADESERSYEELLLRGPNEPPAGYRWRSDAQRQKAADVTERLVGLVGKGSEPAISLRDGAPRPENPLRTVPKQ